TTGVTTNGHFTTRTILNGRQVDLSSGDPMHVTVTYDGTTLSWTIQDTVINTSASSSLAVNIASVVGNAPTVGFVGTTGADGSVQYVQKWTGTFANPQANAAA